ncbi:hypothetical protein B9Z55_024548 [Caenorhabditis nigoni]|uniref:Uncharacterized protein n=1 Tax=Caenorhabditis nigoni TaxID=1611254 RepID=A0A2G5SUT0_9PELO|nr:hypothetical protein B9Z55_024548 [Caenorhabditis nigoni]
MTKPAEKPKPMDVTIELDLDDDEWAEMDVVSYSLKKIDNAAWSLSPRIKIVDSDLRDFKESHNRKRRKRAINHRIMLLSRTAVELPPQQVLQLELRNKPFLSLVSFLLQHKANPTITSKKTEPAIKIVGKLALFGARCSTCQSI